MIDQTPDLHPESRALLAENSLLREELTHLLTTEHELIHIVKPNLLALYQKKIGAWELRALHARVAAARARRKMELAQAAINQGRQPDWTEVEGHLEIEFLTWQQKIAEAAERLDAANRRLDSLLSDAEDRKLKKLYYMLVKRLHPDINPNPDEEHRRLWQRVQTAYERSDIEELRVIAALLEKSLPAEPTPAALERLRGDRDALQRHIASLTERIEQIESQPPFTLRRELADDEWVAAQREAIEARIVQLDAQRTGFEKQLQTLFPPSQADGKLFGPN